MKANIFVVALAIFAGSVVSAKSETPQTVPMTPVQVPYSSLPQGVDILGVATGMDMDTADKILSSQGYQSNTRAKLDHPELYRSELKWTARKGFVLSLNGRTDYIDTFTYKKDNEEVTIQTLAPIFGSKIYEIHRTIRYRRANEMPYFLTVKDAAAKKFGPHLTWHTERGWACWTYSNGQLMASDAQHEQCSPLLLLGLDQNVQTYMKIYYEWSAVDNNSAINYLLYDRNVALASDAALDAIFANAVTDQEKRLNDARKSIASPKL